ncbi:hypothetical protein Athai_44250 [Actinocatenispora thailandica]|uniref:VOC domain-containing protein n=1 Tax=Actinocatenispora thailandica TaxID=227318 RepID=A0A7R7HY43_9ACTN|nr:VOC family protein [Actinocatenispora thailandica]BCJ36922.1 hypothetical protein Athai_44250 [Actinocatenispora thailandica]
MKPSSISGLTYQVADLARTAEFYQALGFRPGRSEEGRMTCYVNWFWLTFVAGEPASGAGSTTYLKVEDLDAYYQGVLAAGFRPENKPARGRTGNREFDLLDPDGYRLAFFEKK